MIFPFDLSAVTCRKLTDSDRKQAESNRAEQSIKEKSIAERTESAERALKREHNRAQRTKRA